MNNCFNFISHPLPFPSPFCKSLLCFFSFFFDFCFVSFFSFSSLIANLILRSMLKLNNYLNLLNAGLFELYNATMSLRRANVVEVMDSTSNEDAANDDSAVESGSSSVNSMATEINLTAVTGVSLTPTLAPNGIINNKYTQISKWYIVSFQFCFPLFILILFFQFNLFGLFNISYIFWIFHLNLLSMLSFFDPCCWRFS